jgi:hypothetical protein
MQAAKKSGLTLQNPIVLYGLIGFISFFVILAVVLASGIATPFAPSTDPAQYSGIARSIAKGNGYKDPVGFWPDLPAYDRMPVWPLMQSVGLAITQGAVSEAANARLTNVICLTLVGIAFAAICRRLGIRPGICLAAGLSASLSPILIYLSIEGFSEVSFVLVASAGLALAFSGSRYAYAAAFVFGLGPLVRTNFIAVLVLSPLLALTLPSARRALASRPVLRKIALACALSLLPTGIWVIRNYTITGRFPFLSSLEGETFYGSNNEVTATDLRKWGYWIMPNEVPGETSKEDLAKRLGSDAELNDYYHRQGIAWIRSHIPGMPRLIVGKLVRAFVAVPWADSPPFSEFVAISSRLILQALCLLTLPYWWRGINRYYLLILASMTIAHLITTVMFYGSTRFTWCFLEVFFIPCAAFGIDRWLDRHNRPANACHLDAVYNETT